MYSELFTSSEWLRNRCVFIFLSAYTLYLREPNILEYIEKKETEWTNEWLVEHKIIVIIFSIFLLRMYIIVRTCDTRRALTKTCNKKANIMKNMTDVIELSFALFGN